MFNRSRKRPLFLPPHFIMPKAKKSKGEKGQVVSGAVLAALKPKVSSHREESKKARPSDSSGSGSDSDTDDKDK